MAVINCVFSSAVCRLTRAVSRLSVALQVLLCFVLLTWFDPLLLCLQGSASLLGVLYYGGTLVLNNQLTVTRSLCQSTFLCVLLVFFLLLRVDKKRFVCRSAY